MISIIIPVKKNRRLEKFLIKPIKIPTPEEIEILVIDIYKNLNESPRSRATGYLFPPKTN